MADRDSQPLLPGATLGVLGSGQLGRMFAMAAARLGYRVHIFAPEHDPPAADVALRQTQASFDDLIGAIEEKRRFLVTSPSSGVARGA